MLSEVGGSECLENVWDAKIGHFTLYKVVPRASSSFNNHSSEGIGFFLLQDMMNNLIYNVSARCTPCKVVRAVHTLYYLDWMFLDLMYHALAVYGL